MIDDEKELPPPGHPLNVLAARLGELLDEDQWAECERLLLKACADKRRLDFLDGNRHMKMGWYVGAAPAGNLMVSSVIQPSGATTSIRAAIDAAMLEAEIEAAEFAEAERQIQTGGF